MSFAVPEETAGFWRLPRRLRRLAMTLNSPSSDSLIIEIEETIGFWRSQRVDIRYFAIIIKGCFGNAKKS
jgi:hypothetical protein